MNPHTSRKDKIKKEAPKFQKIWEKSCSCNNWRLPGEPRSLDNFFLKYRLFNNKINMLNSSRCMDFPNGRYMYF